MNNENNLINLYGELKGQQDMTQLVSNAGKAVGISKDLMTSIGMVESGLRSHVKAKTSSATGLYQFTKKTWDEQLNKYGAQYGIPAGTSAKDPAANAILGALYMKENSDSFHNAFGREAGATEVYMGHFLGAAGRNKYLKLMQENPDRPAFELVNKRQAKANQSIFYGKDGKPLTAQQVYDNFANKLGSFGATVKKPDPIIQKKSQAVVQPPLKEKQEVLSDVSTKWQPPYKVPQQSPQPEVSPQPDAPEQFNSMSAPFIGSDSYSSNSDNTYLVNPDKPNMEELTALQEDEDSTFSGTWDSVKANVMLSPLAVSMRKQFKQATGGIFRDDDDFDPAINQVLAAFGNKPLPEHIKNDPFGHINDGALFTPDVIKMIQSTGLKPQYMDSLKSSINYKDLEQNLEIALENQKYSEMRDKAGLGASLVGGIAGAPFDPYTYAGGGAAAKIASSGKAIFVSGVEGAIGNVASELNQAHMTGAKAELGAAAVGGFVFGSGFRYIGDKFNDAMPNVVTRMKARQEAIDNGLPQDITKIPEGSLPDFGNAKYVALTEEPNAIILRDGTVMSGSNLFNPKTAADAENLVTLPKYRARLPRSLSELNQILYGTKNKELQDMARQFTRASTGITEGGTGAKAATVEDIHSMLTGRDMKWMEDLDKAQKDALNTVQWQLSQGVYSKEEEIGRKIVTAIESGNHSMLTPEEKTVAQIWTRNMEDKHYSFMNPQMYGNAKAKPLVETGRDPSRYVAQVYEDGRVKSQRDRFGGNDGLKAAIKHNWQTQYNTNHNKIQEVFKRMYDESLDVNAPKSATYDKDLEKFVEDYIEKKAYGISNQGEFSRSSLLDDAQEATGMVGIANNNFLNERNIFDSGFQTISDVDGMDFSINDMRMFDLKELGEIYNRRVNGDIAIMGATGRSTQEMKEFVSSLEGKAPAHEVDALKDFIKIATGRARRDPDGAFAMIGRAMMDGTFGTTGTMMWTNQIGEVAGVTTQQIMKLARGGVPALKALFNPAQKFTKKDLQDFNSAFFGNEVNKVLTASFKGYNDRLLQQGYGHTTSKLVAGARYGAQWAAFHSPFTKLLNKTTETMVDFARSGAISDITTDAMVGRKVYSDALLEAADITPEQYKGIKALMRDHVKVNTDGSYSFVKQTKMMRDPRATDLWRLCDYMANDAVFRPNKIGNNYAKQPNVFTQMLLQFKSFYLKGLNGKFVKMMNEAGNGRGVDHSIQTVLATAIGMGMYAAQTQYKAIGIPEESRQDYLDKALDPYMIAYQGLGRSSVFGAPLSLLNLPLGLAGSDLGKLGRTTISPDSTEAESSLKSGAMSTYAMSSEVAANLGQQVPVFGKTMAAASSVYNLAGSMFADEGYEEMSFNKQLFNAVRSLGFNEPTFQSFLNDWADEVGVLDKSMN